MKRAAVKADDSEDDDEDEDEDDAGPGVMSALTGVFANVSIDPAYR